MKPEKKYEDAQARSQLTVEERAELIATLEKATMDERLAIEIRKQRRLRASQLRRIQYRRVQ